MSGRGRIDLAVGALLCLVAVVPLGPVFGGWVWALIATAGLLVGLGVVVLGRTLRWAPALTVLTLTAGYLLAACAAVALTLPVVGTLETVLGPAVLGSPSAWRSLVVAAPPVGGLDGLLVVPLQVGVLAGALVAALAGRRSPWVVVVAPAVLAGAILLGPDQPRLPLLVGLVLAAATACWLAVRRGAAGRREGNDAVVAPSAAATGPTGTAARPGVLARARRGLAGLSVVAVATACVLGLVVGGVVAGPAERFVLRDVITPPVDVAALPSPLAGFRQWSKTRADDVLFTVSGLPAGTPVRLAALDSYDGTTWNVTDAVAGTGSPGRFDRVGDEVGRDALALPPDGPEPATARIEVEVVDYDGPWLPVAGYVSRVDIASERGTRVRSSLVYNSASGTGVVGERLATGDVVTAEVLLPATDGADGAAAASASQPEPQAVPDLVAVLAGDLSATESGPWGQATALSDGLSGTGYYSDGSAEAFPSRAGHGSDRLVQFLSAPVLVGDGEQYAATMALMARSLGLPSRVVVGFVPQDTGETVEVLGSDVTAWTEIAFDGYGWVAFFPTPDEERVPPEDGTRPQQQERPQVQPPVPPIEEVDQPAPVTADELDEDDEEERADEVSALAVLVGAVVTGSVLLLLAPLVAVLLVKALRRSRRRSRGAPAQRAAAAWDEVVDTAVDLGLERPRTATRREVASLLAVGGASELARRADTAVFAAEEPDDADARAMWTHVDEVVGALARQVPLRSRIRARLSTRSLRRR